MKKVDIITNLLACYIRIKNYDGCQELINRTSRNERNNFIIYNTACMNQDQGKYDEALELFSSIGSTNDDDISIMTNTQVAYIKLKKRKY